MAEVTTGQYSSKPMCLEAARSNRHRSSEGPVLLLGPPPLNSKGPKSPNLKRKTPFQKSGKLPNQHKNIQAKTQMPYQC
eukprot:5779728-Amphidinium_carterae.4